VGRFFHTFDAAEEGVGQRWISR
jgi:hypothetical protein